MNYICIKLELAPINPWGEILIAELAELDFESFEQEENTIKAYIQEKLYQKEKADELIERFKTYEVEINVEQELILSQNWNAQWESDFKPVEVDDLLYIYAPFHEKKDGFSQSILIQPQMSFGTGHHQTTWMISKFMFSLNLKNKKVLDVGTGTGVLAILAHQLQAASVIATEIDEISFNNAKENIQLNNINDIQVLYGDIDVVETNSFDVIIANINANVLKSHLEKYSTLLVKNGTLILSGFFSSDENDLINWANRFGFKYEQKLNKDGWSMLCFIKG